MRMRRVVAALLTASLVGVALGVPAAQAAPDPDLTVTAARIIRTTPVAVTGLNTVPVTVEVDAKYAWADANPGMTLWAILHRTAGTGQLQDLYTMPLTRYEGTTQNGKWRGVVNVPSTANGKFQLTDVMVGSFWPGSGDMTDPTPVPNGPVLTVNGTNLPKLTAQVLPDPVPFGKGYSIRWTVINGSTGKPYGTKLKVWLPIDNGCVEQFGGPTYLTDTKGSVTKAYPAAAADALNCLQIPAQPSPSAFLSLFVRRPGIVSATPSKTSAPVGSIVPVEGKVGGAPQGCAVNLQRLYGKTAWRTVSTAKVRQSGRFTLSAQPAYKGNIYYRVSFPACYGYLAGLSKMFVISGT
ncbi:hypothetical protein OG474_16680 [Kribbella sp. NBC_01505]|uniref:hypothetical protein n=1 Tax=Kribbella sp. NBC_01505 TaxID=2903580 RepID=UPI003867E3BB